MFADIRSRDNRCLVSSEYSLLTLNGENVSILLSEEHPNLLIVTCSPIDAPPEVAESISPFISSLQNAIPERPRWE